MPPTLTATPRAGYSVGLRVTIPAGANRYTGNPSFESTYTGVSSYCTATLDSSWAAVGTSSLKLTPDGGNVASRTAVASDGTAGGASMAALGMAAGGTYTVSATLRLAAPQAGTLHSDARKIGILQRATGGATSYLARSAQAPNTAGEHRLSVTFTIPATGIEDVAVRLFNGSIAPTDPVWWDALMVESGTTAGVWDETYPDGATMTIRRDDLTGDPVPVRGATGIPIESTALVDHEAPLNSGVIYLLELSTGARYTAAPVTLDAPLPVLSHPITGAHVQLKRIFGWPELGYANARRLLRIPGRRSPIVFAGAEYAPTSAPELHTETAEDLRAFRQLVAAGETLLLRGSCAGVESAYLSIGERTEARFTKGASDWRRAHKISADHTEIPDPETPAAGDVLGDLAALYPGTLGDVTAAYPGTLLDIAADDLSGA